MSTQQIFVLSEQALTKVFVQITEAQWSLTVPESLHKDAITLRKLMNYYASDDAWVLDTLAGMTIAEVGGKYDGDLLGKNPKKNWDMIVTKAIIAIQALKNSDLEDDTSLIWGLSCKGLSLAHYQISNIWNS